MKLKRAVIICGFLLTLVVVFTIYSAKELTLSVRKTSITQDYKDNQWLHFEDRIKQLEDDLSRHHNAVAEIKVAMQNILSSSTNAARKSPVNYIPLETPQVSTMIYNSSCPISKFYRPKVDIQMLDLYNTLTFDNPDGGVWKQGWRIQIDEKEWNRQNKLKVFVVPHSHNDAGWTRTLLEYYSTQTKHILNNMLQKLPEDPRRKFIWAEISFFSMWWAELDNGNKEAVKRLIKNNQLEIVTGGWVMNDEASSHYISIIHQLTEGHQWLKKHLNYTPISHWSIDPFGLSSTQPALLKSSGLQNMLIQRVHYSVKKHLAKTRNLEFRWRQLWADSDNTDIFCHLMPFYGYDIPHTCGPDPKVCCQFDFKRLPNHGLQCPWKVPPVKITDENVAARAELLLDQYRKKSKLYQTNVVLAPLGDDFRYDHITEWDVQYNNYQKLFDYMNKKLDLHVQAQFGTLSDYFAAVQKEKELTKFPVLSGDFFTYADRDDHYWSGYYTSRPFYKRMDRVLLSYIRAAETIEALTYHSGKRMSWDNKEATGLGHFLVSSRQELSLFQHHDGITGTAKDHVMVDYGKRMLLAIHDCQRIIQHCVNVLLEGPGSQQSLKDDVTHYNFDDVWHSHNTLPEKMQITIGVPDLPSKKIVIYNSLAFARHEVVTFNINTQFIEVIDFQGKRITCQVSPIFEYGSTMSTTKYEISFIASIPAFGTVSYTINSVYQENLPQETSFADVKIYNQYGDVTALRGFKVNVSERAEEFTFQNARIVASFNKLGLLKAVKIGSSIVPVHLDFAKYGVAARPVDRSGAYLFLPDGEASELKIENTVVNVVEGPVISSLTVQLPYVLHKATLYNSPGADGLSVELTNTVDIEETNNFELVMRMATNIDSKDEFFTDANGYQLVKRRRFKKLPLQANYYPMPTKAYIEDKDTRLTVLSSSPLGCSSLTGGEIEIMLDRRLNQDDNLGLGQAVLDNHPTKHIFRVLVEKRPPGCETSVSDHPSGFPTVSASVASESLLNPLFKLIKMKDDEENKVEFYAPNFQLGVDLLIPTFKTNVFMKGTYHTGLVLHRQFLDTCFLDEALIKDFPLSEGKVNLRGLFPHQQSTSLYQATLSFLKTEKILHVDDDISLCPMEMKAFYI
ncbi:alpha-mannosidase 2 isoform X1 [Dendroctonus ponderosae]|uniref:alpha-mannosidase 2 isoform X1 n=1 Tax=Dendroctonus ponderosae TaxID=77166 RepID=UPI002035E2BD|nr:alpha-mannosidase 2 isoform X1 [Dendroctonus ponderosae]KAH1015266.1 hypothetical protein HUJ05_013026 [Dendroctonus ponderosae]